jgi:hypothetical protein
VLTESFVLPLVAGGAGLTAWLLIQRANPTGGTVPMSALSPPEMAVGALIALCSSFKEQMPELYATRLAERGYAAFTFDFSGFGESTGEPRQAEFPDRKIADLLAAAEFLSTLSLVEPNGLAHLAICASAQYGLAALARGSARSGDRSSIDALAKGRARHGERV